MGKNRKIRRWVGGLVICCTCLSVLPAVVTCVFFMVGCNTTATIHLKNGTSVDGEIKKGDSKFIYVKPSSYREYEEKVKLSPEGKTQEVTLLSVQTGSQIGPSTYTTVAVRKKYTYDDFGKIRTVEVDIGANGTVEKRKTYVRDDKGTLVRWEGDADADSSSFNEMIKDPMERELAIDRTNIKDIDHPGFLPLVVGIPLAVGGCAIAIWGYSDSSFGIFYALPGVLLVVSGIGSIISGYVSYAGSKSAAKPPEPNDPKISPVALSDGERTYWGLGMSWSW